MADQYFSTTQSETFKMDTLLAEMRNVENNGRADSWPSQIATKENEKQVNTRRINTKFRILYNYVYFENPQINN